MSGVRAAYGARGRGKSLIGFALLAVVLAAALSSCVGSIADPGTWLALTASDEHTVYALADDPFNTNFVYAGTAGGLVYRAYAANRADGVAGVGLPSDANVAALATDMKTPLLIYAGTSDGFYASTDRGDHWAPRGSGLPAGDTVDALAISTPADALFGGTTAHGVYVSTDAGLTWTPAGAGLPPNANINALYWEPTGQTLFAAVDGVGVFVSTDGGASWTSRSAGLSAHPHAFAAREPTAAATSTATTTTTPATTTASTTTPTVLPSTATLYVGTDKGVFASVDGGVNWTALMFTQSVQSLALDPQHPTWIYAGTQSDVFRSEDDGATWASLAPGLSRPVTALLTVLPAGQQTVVFAASGQLQRFPPYPSTSNSSPVLGTIFVVLLFVVILWVFWRTRRRMMEADRRLPLGMQPEVVKPKETDETDETDEAEGVQHYISMMTPPTPRDAPPLSPLPPRDPRDANGGPDEFSGIEN